MSINRKHRASRRVPGGTRRPMSGRWLPACALAALLMSAASPAHEDHGDAYDGVAVETLARASHSWDGASLPAYPEAQPEVTVLRIRVPAGVRLARHWHPVINAAVLLEGRLRVVMDDGRERVLEPGEALVEVVGSIHYGESIGSGPAEVLVFYAGARGLDTTVYARQAPPPPDAP